MKRILSSFMPALLAVAFAAPAFAASPNGGVDAPSCDGDDKKKDEDKTKNPSADPNCGDGKGDQKDDKKGQTRL